MVPWTYDGLAYRRRNARTVRIGSVSGNLKNYVIAGGVDDENSRRMDACQIQGKGSVWGFAVGIWDLFAIDYCFTSLAVITSPYKWIVFS